MKSEIHKLIIIGSGPAGLTAALYAARANLNPLVIGGLTFGGQLMITTEVENFPGFPKGVQGPELMQAMIEQAERFGAKIIYDDATKVDFSHKPFKVSAGHEDHMAESVIIATGASSLWLGLPSEERLRGKGVSSCATCDGFFFKGKEVAVIGGGDAALEEALYLTKFATKVTVLNRSDKLRASKIMQDRALANPKIGVLYNKTVEEFLGADYLTGLRIKDAVSGQTEELPAGGTFVAIGHKPNTEIFKGQITLDAKGYIEPTDQTKTNVAGIFVAGDVRDYRYRQAVTAAGMGCMAALDAEKYLHMDQG
ncbi:MAG: thioredoxin-disulfide reductase [Candidatus Doudnabacteria bacterium RIFCSPLOWO2_02_FULL_49_13]|uniref:Thioredoxin reductase n=1 Tax=Candidatus Doudnabacteria bacterium RIFCSPHIGHO2_12_FULL_48_16 TaxID=1817838 RepID=A0A1F5PKB4_9BACT|nr:MAG: thioredoxin-disulfide reductase [Candidatus Doudnabacteria bacterium RIFCSPHIGHO2_02_FULL_49_24]OGE88496.1 MAG: thioredoxin-disulfide reductase [Candidatus Doudnabacteria bacterium RIFCSPHIGHO2_01_FULL_50_67]OGE90244.1 MAG: thioredoxin-disulfide reductase [Candidatus Doudnabacteria bacterium RIFCSPHIGHO2_12_FULL_48_16]OGE96951.1 MAG: thioredoxin-disulfide reductase [Candidatus Doudnabacteria bacterium RIFCSPLOWO2_01_FULL_49_40]OGF02300.1 MAG: thioredoxin-disulfide reductase [Candidatus 